MNLDTYLEDIHTMDSYDNEVSSEIYFLPAPSMDTQEMMDELMNSGDYPSLGQIIDNMEEFRTLEYEPNNNYISDMENLNEDPEIKSYLFSTPGTSNYNDELVDMKDMKPLLKLELDAISGNERSQVNTPVLMKSVEELQLTFPTPSLVSN